MVLQEEEPSIWAGSSDEQLDELEAPAPVQGGVSAGSFCTSSWKRY